MRWGRAQAGMEHHEARSDETTGAPRSRERRIHPRRVNQSIESRRGRPPPSNADRRLHREFPCGVGRARSRLRCDGGWDPVATLYRLRASGRAAPPTGDMGRDGTPTVTMHPQQPRRGRGRSLASPPVHYGSNISCPAGDGRGGARAPRRCRAMPSGVSTAPSGFSRPPLRQVVTSVENTRASRRAHESRR